MAQMRLVGAEVRHDFTERIQEILDDDHIRQSQEEKLLKQLQTSWDDIETDEQELGFDKFSLESFRQDLLGEITDDEQKYADMPNGVFTGFVADPDHGLNSGIIALLGYPARQPGEGMRPYDAYDLIYIDRDGNEVMLNPQDVLEVLAHHKDQDRVVPRGLDTGDAHDLSVWAAALKNWLHHQAVDEVEDEHGDKHQVAGAATMELIAQIQQGHRPGKSERQPQIPVEDRYREHNVDLILWFAVCDGQ